MSYIRFHEVGREYRTGEVVVEALKKVSFEIERGKFTLIVGPSGAGKTTLLNLLGGMDIATCGEIFVDGREISAFNERQLTDYRRFDIGFVFQFYNLIPNLTAKENVELAAQICKEHMEAEEALAGVGLQERMDHFPAQLSGGEQQRVAIARALAKKPKLLLCDEPTGALDDQTGRQVLTLLQSTVKESGMSVVVITHNAALIPMADRVIRVKDGRVASVSDNETPKAVEEIQW
ncbi:MAG: ABC transporter ATP-binding protein [Lachnospiraceae bacterium]|nr:ABC transporter ATP-binding protein [Lachnospiraceae bacterium]MBF1004738.1 ABC transporter ATP-binding protein [Lachnospiraceae bacterium]MBF1017390.1 ABC transporter ATP-binding protein [Lachnospiraceae bacterium]